MSAAAERVRTESGSRTEYLIDRCVRGDAGAWRSLLAEVRRLTLDLGRRRYGLGRDDAEDVAQVVQLRVAERLRQLQRPEAFPLWIRRLVQHAVVDHLRQRRAQRVPELSLDALADAGSDLPLEPRAEDDFEQVALRADLGRALARLPAHYQEPIELHLLRGLPQDEVGRLLGRPRSTVASQIERGLGRLRRALSPAFAETC